MLRSLMTMVIGVMLSTAAFAMPVIGEPAPAFSATDVLSGKPISLADYKGKIVVLEWNQFECPFVKKFYSTNTMQALQEKSVKQGVVWISINSSAAGKEGFLDNATQAKTSIAEHHSHASHYLLDADGTIGHAYGAKTTPHMFVIDPDGKLAYMGAMDDKPTADTSDIASAQNYVALALKSLQTHTAVKTTNTRPYGCFVKY